MQSGTGDQSSGTRFNGPIFTLGPRGTDAIDLAERITTGSVISSLSFREALEGALAVNALALVPCGLVQRGNEKADDCWADLHFEFSNRMQVAEILHCRIKPLSIARNRHSKHKASIALHPTTKGLLKEVKIDDLNVVETTSKVSAVEMCASGSVEYCLGSGDIIKKFKHLEVNFNYKVRSMIWVVYEAGLGCF